MRSESCARRAGAARRLNTTKPRRSRIVFILSTVRNNYTGLIVPVIAHPKKLCLIFFQLFADCRECVPKLGSAPMKATLISLVFAAAVAGHAGPQVTLERTPNDGI